MQNQRSFAYGPCYQIQADLFSIAYQLEERPSDSPIDLFFPTTFASKPRTQPRIESRLFLARLQTFHERTPQRTLRVVRAALSQIQDLNVVADYVPKLSRPYAHCRGRNVASLHRASPAEA